MPLGGQACAAGANSGVRHRITKLKGHQALSPAADFPAPSTVRSISVNVVGLCPGNSCGSYGKTSRDGRRHSRLVLQRLSGVYDK